MRQQAKHITTHSQNNKFDAYILKTYWRMKLYRTLHEPLLITEVIDTGDSFSFTSISFDDYWNDVHVSLNNYIQELKISWYSYINSDFDNVEPYCNAYLRLINKLPFVKTLSQEQDKFILERALGLKILFLEKREMHLHLLLQQQVFEIQYFFRYSKEDYVNKAKMCLPYFH